MIWVDVNEICVMWMVLLLSSLETLFFLGLDVPIKKKFEYKMKLIEFNKK